MSKTKTCSQCKGEIPKDAKKCQHCGSKQSIGCLGAVFAILFISVVVVIVAGIIGGSGDGSKTKPSANSDGSTDAKMLCIKAIKANAKFPSSVDISIFSSPPAQAMSGGGFKVLMSFESKNGLGNLIPQTAHCEVKAGKLQHFSVSNR